MATETPTSPRKTRTGARKPAAKAARPGARKRALAKRTTSPDGAATAAERPAGETGTPKIKSKLVRDSFTMPRADFELIGQLKTRSVAMMRPAKKSELLRAGLQVLSALDDDRLRAALEALTPLKPGRPKKSE